MTRPVAVAITGGIGAGKSEALRSFARHGAAVVSSDEIVHELLLHDEVKAAVVERLGQEVLAADGSLDRAAMAAIVFHDPEALAGLEALLHPLVSAEYLRWREQLAELPDAPRVCATEVPLLYEVGSDAHFDKVVVITAARGSTPRPLGGRDRAEGAAAFSAKTRRWPARISPTSMTARSRSSIASSRG